MGTRADFYTKDNGKLVWRGSVAWDGYEVDESDKSQTIAYAVKKAKNQKDFIKALSSYSKTREDWTSPSQGWPWPWETSDTTDMAYVFNGKKTITHRWGKFYKNENDEDGRRTEDWPNMKNKQNVAKGKRSGIIMMGM